MASVAQTYQTNQAMSASPLLRLLTVYDYALSACRHGQIEPLSKALRVLLEHLDFSHEPAYGLASVYQWCGELARKGDYDEAARLLKELRDAWAQASHQLSAAERPAVGAEAATVYTSA